MLRGAEARPAPEQLFRAAIAAQKAQDAKAWKFTYREDEVRPDERRTYDVIMLEGDNYRKLILIDDKPLDAKTRKRVEEDLEKTRAARRRGVHFGFSKAVNAGELDALLFLCDLRLTGEEMVSGRKTWRVEAEPIPGLKWADKKEEQVLSAHHTLWFDQEDGFDIKRSDLFFRAADGTQAGTQFEIELQKVGAAWLSGNLLFRYDVKFAPFIRERGEVRYRYYDYKRFQVESTFSPN